MDNQTLYEQFIEKLVAVNDETKREIEHNRLKAEFRGWKEGVNAAIGVHFNGDYYYIGLEEKGEVKARPMCCGEFLDWEAK